MNKHLILLIGEKNYYTFEEIYILSGGLERNLKGREGAGTQT
jgi:hypothetical protein